MYRNIPNILTALRIALVPVFAMLVLTGMSGYAAAVFAVAGATDVIDGLIARRFNLQSHLGELLDPLADKFLLTASYLVLTYKGAIPLWLCVLVAVRDLLMLGGIAVIRYYGKTPNVSPAFAGKLNTLLQTATVLYVLFIGGRLSSAWFTALAALTAFITVYSGLYYAWRHFSGGGDKHFPSFLKRGN
ncbi:MAG: CDP-alcohol phosphatidyltransferase family protein [Deltaproteobacteria bacterium]|nr:CDP-alcohol phosphatidyltransferase family protein [Deltaproteobacteria bacterium]